ncbi:MAG TPA: AmmeMemoRadiSam system protein A [Anaeromyxobacteraceae bacterium]|nr:AmmeMemoRadiSam system protein A [Anaeromyxobacteraceae bacterium]
MNPPLSAVERAALLGVARASLRHHLGLGPPPEIPDAGALGEPRGAFVTLYREGELRGCIGRFEPNGTLARTVADMAVAAASEDPRFPPVRTDEADELSLRISALGARERLRDASDLRVGEHGLLVRRGFHRGTLLPVVAVERGWDAPTFLKHACLKAGLPPDAWRDADTVVEIFGAEEFGDPEPATT